MPQDASEVRIAADGQLYVAPEGTAQPTNVDTALNAAFGTALGYTSEDGVTFAVGRTTTDIMAWQSRTAVRTLIESEDVTAAFTLLQWRGTNIKLAFGGGSVTNQGGGYFRYDPPSAGTLSTYVLVIDFQDGGFKYRLVAQRVQLAENTEVPLNRANPAGLPLTFKTLAPTSGLPWYLLSNDNTMQS